MAEKESPAGSAGATDFITFIVSLGTSGMLHLGEIPDPDSKQPSVNLSLARQTIDLLLMLKEKTSGNRSQEESRMLDFLLYELQMKYVAKSHVSQ